MSITNNNINLVELLIFLSIKKIIINSVIKIIEKKADYKLFLSKYWLNKKIYFFIILVFKKWH